MQLTGLSGFSKVLWLVVHVVALVFFLVLAGCGGSGNSSGSSGDFSISATPANLTLGVGGAQICDLSVSSINDFSASVHVSVGTLPPGVTATPSTFSLIPGKTQQVTITASATAQSGSTKITFEGASGSLSHGTQVSLGIVAQVTGTHAPIRTRYLRTNSFYDPNSLQFAPPHFSVYDATHKQFFISNPYLNEIDVFDSVHELQIGQIPVPLAWGLDISPLDGSLFVASFLGDIYQINTGTLSITKRYPSASVGPNGYAATEVFVLSDGRLALLGSQGGILGVDGASSAAVWDPLTNSLDTGSSGSVCDGVGNIGGFAVSGDRTRILLTTVDEGGGGEPVCSYDPILKQATMGVFPQATFVRQIVPTPDGKRFFLTTNLYGIAVFDAKTVQLLGQTPNPSSYSGIPNAPSGAVISLDGRTLYLVDQSSGAVGGFDTTSLVQTGWVPSFTVFDAQSGIVISAIDETGLIAGPIGHGVGFVDASQMTTTQPTSIGSSFPNPPTGPLAGGTMLTGFASGNVTDSAALSQIYVGNVPGAEPSFAASPGYVNSAQVTTPPSPQTQAIDLTVLLNDGGVGIAPEGFSFGPTILEVVPNAATAEGGQLGAIIGYGLGQTTADVQVIVGGTPAPVTVLHSGAPIEPYPFPTEGLQFTIPPGTSGTAVDVTVTTASGSATAKGAFHYVPAVESYAFTGNLQAGIYDSHKDIYYFTGQSQIQVLSKTNRNWLSPIALPGVTGKTQLLAISESPDGTKLAVSDFGGQAIYVLNPDVPTSAVRYPMPLDYNGTSLLAPAGLAITNGDFVYFATADISGTGTPAFHKLDTSTGLIQDLGMFLSGGQLDQYVRVLLSPDGSRLYSNIEGATFWLDTSNDQIHNSSTAGSASGGFPDLAVSGDGSTVDIDDYLTDLSLGPETTPTYVDWETWFPTATTGQKLNQDGSIMFQPLTDGLDLIARNTGRLLYRVQIPGTTAAVYDSLVVGLGRNNLAVITTAGVSFVDLSTLSIPTGDSQPFLDRVGHKTRMASKGRDSVPTATSSADRSSFLRARPELKSTIGPKRPNPVLW